MKKLLLLTALLLVGTISLQIRSPDTPNTHFMNIFGLHVPGTGSANGTKYKVAMAGGNIGNPNAAAQAQADFLKQQAGQPHSLVTSSGVYPGYNPSTNTYSGGGTVSSSYNPYGGSYGGGGGGLSVAQPDTSGLQNSVRSRISAIQNAYGSLQGQIQPVIQDKVNQLLQNYGTQQKALNDQFGQTTGQTQAMFGARGLGDSSFQGNALDQAGKTYNTSLDALNQDKQNNLASVGQYAQNLVGGAKAASDQYNQYLPNLGQYSASDLSSLDSQLAGALPGIQQQVSGLGTNQQFLNTLNQYAPQANQGASQLADQLKTLATSQAPLFAKNQIAQGLVKSSQLQDPNAQAYYSDYFNKLLNGQA